MAGDRGRRECTEPGFDFLPSFPERQSEERFHALVILSALDRVAVARSAGGEVEKPSLDVVANCYKKQQ